MKIKGEKYEDNVIVPKVWEEIIVDGNKERVLVTEDVSKYIRGLESQVNGHSLIKAIDREY